MLKKLFSRRKKPPTRQLDSPEQLAVGDMLTLKYREVLPADLREKLFEVVNVGTYEYATGTQKELVLKGEDSQIYFLGLENEDGELSLCFSQKVSRQLLLRFIDEQQFAQLWSEEWAELSVDKPPEQLVDWLCPHYRQTHKEQEAYYYPRDCHGQNLDAADDGEELRYHQCEGSDEGYGLGVEIGEDGSTEVFLQRYCGVDVIEQMWPHGH